MWRYTIVQIYVSWFIMGKYLGSSSPITPFTTYTHSVELQENIAELWWKVDNNDKEITFELHMKTTGWIALGISPAGGMKGADIAVGWVDSSGKVTVQDRYAYGEAKPVIDNTTQDWFAIHGREQNGWTAIQFKRLFDTCDIMDYPVRSGTNKLIFAYGLVDPDPNRSDGDITYHETRRGTRVIPLRSYNDPPSEDKFSGLETFEWRTDNYLIPPNDTTYHCKIHKAPSGFTTKRHAIGHKILINSSNVDLVHHLLLYECDPTTVFDDANLPDGLCDDLSEKLQLCLSNIATGWAIGGDFILEFPEQAGYPIGSELSIKYYLIETHYNNPKLSSGRRDSSGIRFYLGSELRQYDLGFLTFGTSSNPMALAIPPKVDKFIVDSYCLPNASRTFPESGITVTSAFPHTHLQGTTVWTKLIRNGAAVQYLFNADAFDFNHQFSNRLPEPIKLYPGDAFATRCIYSTTNKNVITIGGLKTTEEMCLNMFTYYPRMNDMYLCGTINHRLSWQKIMNISTIPTFRAIKQWLLNLTWTPESAAEWQEFYNDASRMLLYGSSGQMHNEIIPKLPTYQDLPTDICQKSAGQQKTYSAFLIFILLFINVFRM